MLSRLISKESRFLYKLQRRFHATFVRDYLDRIAFHCYQSVPIDSPTVSSQDKQTIKNVSDRYYETFCIVARNLTFNDALLAQQPQ
ncbi:hypothetical protein GEMRC1_009495 [Eukaryota sp. GEM-RC1]